MATLMSRRDMEARNHPIKRRRRCGFTIVELLVATAVLALMLALLVQIANHTLQASRVTTQQLESTQSSRRVLDTLASDLAYSVFSSGATIIVQPRTGSVTLSLLTSGRGPITDMAPPRFLAINYKLEKHQIIRSYRSVGWSEQNLLVAAESAAGVTTDIAPLADGVLQFAVLAVLENGEIVSVTSLPLSAGVSQPTTYQGEVVPTGWTALIPAKRPYTSNSERVKSLLFAIASVDQQNLQLLSESQKNILPPPATSDPIKEWEDDLAGADLPAPARAAIRFQSKVISLP